VTILFLAGAIRAAFARREFTDSISGDHPIFAADEGNDIPLNAEMAKLPTHPSSTDKWN